jgi:CRP/FNR family transcriptional regulator, anaerobic regulatory protein
MTALQRTNILHGLSARGDELLAKGRTLHVFPAGKTIIEKGQPVSGAYFVIDGRLRVFSYMPNGNEATLYLINPGETCVLALNSLFNNLLYPAWVETEEPARVALIPGSLYRTLFETERVVQDITVHALSTVVFRLMAELESVHSDNLRQRLASCLLGRASTDGVLRKTQEEIAGLVGSTREAVARLMCEFVARGLVKTGRGQVTILSPSELAEIVRRDERP